MHRNAGQTLTAGKWGGLIALGAVILVLGAWPGQAAELPTPKKPKAPAAAAPNPPATKSSPPLPATKSPPTLRSPQIKATPESTSPGSRRPEGGKGPSISTTTTREPLPNQEDPGVSPCGKRQPPRKGLGKLSQTADHCAEGSEPGGEPDGEPGSELGDVPGDGDGEVDGDGDGDGDGADNESDSDMRDSAPSSGRGGAAHRGGGDGEDAGGDSDENSGDSAYSEGDEGAYDDTSSEGARSAPDFDELTGKIPGFKPFGGDESGSSESSTVEGGRPWYEKLGKPGGSRPPPVNDADEEDEE